MQQLRKFTKESGFKILAMTHLSSCEYSIVLYILNVAISGLEQFVTTELELASLVGHTELEVKEALAKLEYQKIIKITYPDVFNKGSAGRTSISLGFEFEIQKWRVNLNSKKEADTKDAIVFPFRRQGQANIKIIESKGHIRKDDELDPLSLAIQKIVETFIFRRSLDEDELKQAYDDAKVLIETYPLEQILMMIRHFTLRIPTLSLLASSWQHFQELLEQETAKVDFLDARQKHLEMDSSLRDKVSKLLNTTKDLSEEELTVLQILERHQHPRRQLYWAYQMRSRYPNLAKFFDECAELMLPVTTMGTVIKKDFE